jgi:hypothetical protein
MIRLSAVFVGLNGWNYQVLDFKISEFYNYFLRSL